MDTENGDFNDCLAGAVRYLSAREHSRQELFRKLGNKGFNPELIESVLDQLAAKNLQSDKRYCESLLRSRQQKGYGPHYIRNYLREKGVDSNLIESVLDFNHPSWQKLLIATALKKYGQQKPADTREKVKQTSFLMRRGFSGEMIRRFLDGKLEYEIE